MIGSDGRSDPVAVGLVGAGTWARRMHAPMLAAGPETRLAAVWSRRLEPALSIVGQVGPVPVTDDFDAFLARCEAVAFAVPPDLDLYGSDGALHYDTDGMDHDECWPVIRREFAYAVRSGRAHPLDVHRGLAIQRLIAQAAAGL